MLRVCLLSVSMFFVGCADSVSEASNSEVFDAKATSMEDQRYTLSLYETPALTYSDAKNCYQLARIGEAEIKKTPGIMGRLFGEHFKSYWKFLVDVGSQSDASKEDVFIDGKFMRSDVDPAFKLTGSISSRSEQCGYVTGRMLIRSGFANIGDVFEVEGSNEEVSFDADEALGMYILGQAAENVFANNQEMVVDCAAIMRANLPHGDEPDTNYFVWISGLSDIVSEGVVKSSALAEISEPFKLLFDGKGDPSPVLKTIDSDVKANCDAVADSAVSIATAEAQK